MDTLNLTSLLSPTFAVASGYSAIAYKIGNVVHISMAIHPTSDLPADTTKYTLLVLPKEWRPVADIFTVKPGSGLSTVSFEILSRDGRLSALKYGIGGQSVQWTTTQNGYFSATYLVGGNE